MQGFLGSLLNAGGMGNLSAFDQMIIPRKSRRKNLGIRAGKRRKRAEQKARLRKHWALKAIQGLEQKRATGFDNRWTLDSRAYTEKEWTDFCNLRIHRLVVAHGLDSKLYLSSQHAYRAPVSKSL